MHIWRILMVVQIWNCGVLQFEYLHPYWWTISFCFMWYLWHQNINRPHLAQNNGQNIVSPSTVRNILNLKPSIEGTIVRNYPQYMRCSDRCQVASVTVPMSVCLSHAYFIIEGQNINITSQLPRPTPAPGKILPSVGRPTQPLGRPTQPGAR